MVDKIVINFLNLQLISKFHKNGTDQISIHVDI